MTTADDEQRHPPGTELTWAETWTFDFTAADGSVGGWARLVLLPNLRRAWYHAFSTGVDRQLVAVVDTEVPLPDRDLEIRTTGLWATHICETSLDHWTIGLEAFGVGLDDPGEMFGRQFGDQVPLGLDLEWEAEGTVDGDGPGDGYQQACRVSGEVLVGAEEIDLDGIGFRDHRWGVLADWDHRWFDVRGRLDDGTWFSSSVVDGDLASAHGTVDGAPAEVVSASQRLTSPGIPAAGRVRLAGTRDLEVGLDPVGVTPLDALDPERRRTLAPRALCRCTTSTGASGWAWAVWNEPQPGG